jgi:hypothetical protein
MTTNRNIAWDRIFVEGVVIVASILLAFAIDAWWQDREDRQREVILLEALLGEFERLQTIQAYDERYYGSQKASAIRLVEIGMGVGASATGREIDELLAELWWWPSSMEWRSAELDSITSSGDLTLISDDILRRNVGGWPVRLDLVRDVIDRDHDFFRNRFMPTVSKHFSLQRIIMASDHSPGHPDQLFDFGHTFEIDDPQSYREKLQSAEIQNLLLERASNIEDILTQGFGKGENFGYVTGHIEVTIDLLKQELAD